MASARSSVAPLATVISVSGSIATWVMFAWLNDTDPGTANSLDSYVGRDGRRFVRHYLLDFGTSLGASTTRVKAVQEGREYWIELDRMFAAALTLGLYQRRWQDDVGRW